MFNKEFYPTPNHIADKMIKKLWKGAQHFLEPSAGKDDLVEAITKHHYNRSKNVDCIENAPELCAILQDKDFTIVGHDFLSYDGVSYYDAIVMNPPFSNGDEHLLKAWDFLHDGEIVCLLNEETIKNPHTATRQRLKTIIDAHGEVDYLGDCFSTAERKTKVRVALVYLKKQAEDDSLDLWVSDTDENTINDNIDTNNIPAVIDRLGNMQRFYDEANTHMFKAFQHIRKAQSFIDANDITIYSSDLNSILGMATKNINSAKAAFTRKHRNRAWHKVFSRMEFHKHLDQKQRNELLRDVDRNGNIPFTAENIKGTLQNVFSQRDRLFEQSVANVFDGLTRYYKGNTNHTEGWKSNDNYKINKKIVFPHGCEFNDKYGRYFSLRWGYYIDIYNDLDRVLCVLTERDFAKCETIGKCLERKFDILGRGVKAPFDNETESRFFHIKFVTIQPIL